MFLSTRTSNYVNINQHIAGLHSNVLLHLVVPDDQARNQNNLLKYFVR